MSPRVKFNVQKGVEILLFVSSKINDLYTVLKIIYFADRIHLERYGRLLCGDTYIAMKHGPVPSGLYDILKYARGDSWFSSEIISGVFIVEGDKIKPLRSADVNMLSESDVEALVESIQKYGHLSFGKLKKLSHDQAYNSVEENDVISYEKLIESIPSSTLLKEYAFG